MDNLRDFLEFNIFSSDKVTLKVYNIIGVILIFFIAKLFLWIAKKYLTKKENQQRIDSGKKYSIYQILSYIIYILAILLSVDSIGIKITVLLAGSTALLVGLGLGLQDLFRDMVAGFILLSERTITAGDIVDVGGTIGKIKEIGLRTTSLTTRDDIVLIVPNTKFTSENVVNWTQNRKTVRFSVDVGVAYGSDTTLVKELLIECAKQHSAIKSNPEPYVFFQDFGDSSLNFTLYFMSDNLFRIQQTKSDLRFTIDQKFRENNINIPFPQRDLWIRQIPETK